MTVDELHAEMHFSLYEAELRRFTGLWNTLQKLQQEARANPKLLARYRQLLDQGIARLKVLATERLTEDEAIAAINAIMDDYGTRRTALLEDMERRQQSLEDWVMRWHPTVWQAFERALTVAMTDPTTPQMTRLKDSVDAIFQAFSDPSLQIDDAAVRKAIAS